MAENPYVTMAENANAELKRLRALAREVQGSWTAHEPALRVSIGNTNYAVIAEKLAAVQRGQDSAPTPPRYTPRLAGFEADEDAADSSLGRGEREDTK